MRPAVPEGNPEALGTSDGDICAEFAGRLYQCQGKQVCSCSDDGTGSVRTFRKSRVVVNLAIQRRVLQESPENRRREVELPVIAANQPDPLRPCPRLHYFDRLREAPGGNEIGVGVGTRHAPAHVHRLGSSGTFVQQRGVCHLKSRQITDHRLEIQESLQPPLRNLGLVGSVLCVPSRILENVPPDYRRGDAVVVTHADERAVHRVLSGDGLAIHQRLVFAPSFANLEQTRGADCLRNHLVDELVQFREAQRLEHARHIVRARTDMATREVVGDRERMHRFGAGVHRRCL